MKILLQTTIEQSEQLLPLPELGLLEWIVILGIIAFTLFSAGAVIWAVWNFAFKKNFRNTYKDRYEEIIATCENNCPDSIKGRRFSLAPDALHEGAFKGFITGYNLAKITGKYYDVIVYRADIFKLLNPKTWFTPSRVALMDSEKLKITVKGEEKVLRNRFNRPVFKWHSDLMGNISWYTIGTNRIGFFEFAVNDKDLTSEIVSKKVTGEVTTQQLINLAKDMGEMTDLALRVNPEVRSKQKLQEQVIIK